VPATPETGGPAGAAETESAEGTGGTAPPVPAPVMSANRLLALSAATVVWTVVLLSVAAAETDGLSRILAGLGGLVGVAVAVLGLFPPLRPPSIPRSTAIWAVVAVLCADGLVTIGWPLWSYYRANTTVTVVDWSLTHNQNLLPRHSATFHATVDAHRTYVVITFQATDNAPQRGSCAPLTTLSVVPASTSSAQRPVNTALGERAKFRLLPGQREVTLTVTVVNVRDDANCAVDLHISRVVLSNG
jgi:hypothetical protein